MAIEYILMVTSALGWRGTAVLLWAAPWAAGGFQLQCLEQSLPLLLHWPGVCRAVPPTNSHSSLQLMEVFPLLTHINYPRGTTPITQPWPGMGQSRSQLALAPWAQGKHPADSDRSHPCILPYQTLPVETQNSAPNCSAVFVFPPPEHQLVSCHSGLKIARLACDTILLDGGEKKNLIPLLSSAQNKQM